MVGKLIALGYQAPGLPVQWDRRERALAYPAGSSYANGSAPKMVHASAYQAAAG